MICIDNENFLVLNKKTSVQEDLTTFLCCKSQHISPFFVKNQYDIHINKKFYGRRLLISQKSPQIVAVT